MKPRVVSCVFLAITVFVVGCSSGEGGSVTTATPASDVTETTHSAPDATSTSPTSIPADAGDPVAPRELAEVVDIGVVTLEAVDSGPHPVLGWEPVQGAALYWLMISDSDGEPYWAWTGAHTTVRIGGGDSTELNQTAAIHEDMTWRVAAFDETGTLVALSETGALAP